MNEEDKKLEREWNFSRLKKKLGPAPDKILNKSLVKFFNTSWSTHTCLVWTRNYYNYFDKYLTIIKMLHLCSKPPNKYFGIQNVEDSIYLCSFTWFSSKKIWLFLSPIFSQKRPKQLLLKRIRLYENVLSFIASNTKLLKGYIALIFWLKSHENFSVFWYPSWEKDEREMIKKILMVLLRML